MKKRKIRKNRNIEEKIEKSRAELLFLWNKN
jgi:hypothetical protein